VTAGGLGNSESTETVGSTARISKLISTLKMVRIRPKGPKAERQPKDPKYRLRVYRATGACSRKHMFLKNKNGFQVTGGEVKVEDGGVRTEHHLRSHINIIADHKSIIFTHRAIAP